MSDRAPTLPVNLLLKDRPCLVVGAGMVAWRKVGTLLAHGARVIAVAPEIVDGLRDLAALGRLEVRRSTYDVALLDEIRPVLLYAATDDDALNGQIVRDGAARRILSSSVSCWEEGDFISPAVIPWRDGQVSVTTEGASCRQARFMRERLEAVLGGPRDYVRIGRSTRAACEQTQPDEARSREWVAMLRQLAGLEEFLILEDGGLQLLAWAAPDPALERAAMRILGLDPNRAHVRRGRAEVLEGLGDVEGAVGHPGVHLDALLIRVPGGQHA